jgi:hypothetical protein
MGLSEKQYQVAAGLARNCRFFLTDRPGPRPGAFAALGKAERSRQPNPISIAIGLREAAGVEAGLGKRALALDETLLGLRAAEDGAVLSRFRLAALAFLQLSRSTQIDDLSQRRRLGYFLRKASIDTTFVSLGGSVGFSAF